MTGDPDVYAGKREPSRGNVRNSQGSPGHNDLLDLPQLILKIGIDTGTCAVVSRDKGDEIKGIEIKRNRFIFRALSNNGLKVSSFAFF
jgi:hypothetical protein